MGKFWRIERDITSYTSERDRRLQEKGDIQQDIAALQQEISTYEAEIAAHEVTYTAEYDEDVKELEALNSRFNTLTSQKETLAAENSTLNTEKARLEKEKNDKEKRVLLAEDDGSYHAGSTSAPGLLQSVTNAQNALQILKNEKSSLEARNNGLTSYVDGNELAPLISKLKNEEVYPYMHDFMEGKSDLFLVELAKLNEMWSTSKRDIEDLKKLKASSAQELDELEKASKNGNLEKRLEIRQKKQKLAQAQQGNYNLEKSVADAHNKTVNQTKKLAIIDMRNEYQREVDELMEKNRDLKAQIAAFTDL